VHTKYFGASLVLFLSACAGAEAPDAGGAARLSASNVNADPVLAPIAPVDTTEGVEVDFNFVATDADGDTVTISVVWGDGSPVEVGANLSHTWEDDGTFSLFVTAQDGNGGVAVQVATVTVANANPVISEFGPYNGVEASEITMTAVASDVPADTIEYLWTFPDMSTQSGPTATMTYADDGTFTADLTVTDEDGGSTTEQVSIIIANVNPTVNSMTTMGGDEGVTLNFTGAGSDPGDDTLTYTWDFGNGDTLTGADVDYAFPDNGDFDVVLTISDEDGGASSETQQVTIANVAPVIDLFTIPVLVDEGSIQTLVANAVDASGDVLTYAWDFDDGQTGTGSSVDHAWMDEGRYNVVVTVTDDDGASVQQTDGFNVVNVAPSFDAPGPATATEGQPYGWTAPVTEPGNDVLSFTLAVGPANASVVQGTGEIIWTPDGPQALGGPIDFQLAVNDGDGGVDTISWSVDVDFVDSDADGMSDYWEGLNGLDSTNGSDATADDDMDGRSNKLEFEQGTDPNVYEGPAAPALDLPGDDEEATSLTPELSWVTADHPLDLPVTFDVEVYSEDTLVNLIASTMSVDAEAWTVDTALTEDTWYYWRVRSVDEYTASEWSEPFGMRINATEVGPTTPVLSYPIGSEVAAVDPTIVQWLASTDVDDDYITYDVQVYNDAEDLITSAMDIDALEWTIDVSLMEDALYTWRARARDEHGLISAWTPREEFWASFDDAAPTSPGFVTPMDGDELVPTQPEVELSPGTDAERSALVYELELAQSASFDGPELVQAELSDDDLIWDAASAGVTLEDRTDWFARARSIDTSDIASPWTSISFRVGGQDVAPEVPVLLSPNGGAMVRAGITVTLEASVPKDADGDQVTLEYAIATDAEMTNLLESGMAPERVYDYTIPNDQLSIYWTARGVDETGKEGPWAEPRLLNVDDSGCSTGRGAWHGLFLLPLMFLRRRD